MIYLSDPRKKETGILPSEFRIPVRWIAIDVLRASRVAGGTAGYQRNFSLRIVACHAGQFLLSR